MGNLSNDPSAVPATVAALCEREYPRLVGALTLYCGDRGVAEELAQEALVWFFRNPKRVLRLDNRWARLNRAAINVAKFAFSAQESGAPGMRVFRLFRCPATPTLILRYANGRFRRIP